MTHMTWIGMPRQSATLVSVTAYYHFRLSMTRTFSVVFKRIPSSRENARR